MYDIQLISRVHLEPSAVCNAACPMCARFIGGGRQYADYLTKDSISIDKFKQIFNDDFIRQIEKWSVCGVVGDPCAAPDLVDIIKHIIHINPAAEINIDTNGGLRNSDWWSELGKLMNSSKTSVTFGIDGLEDTNHIYRRNVSWTKLIDNVTSFINAGGFARIQMLVFKHNEHQIDAMRALSNSIGAKKFVYKLTNRFRKTTDGEYKYPVEELGNTSPSYWLYPASGFTPKVLSDKNLDACDITCQALQDREIYVNSSGEVYPCCFLFSDIKSNPEHYTGLNLSSMIITADNTLESALTSEVFQFIKNSWQKTLSTGRIKKCADICGVNNKVIFKS